MYLQKARVDQAGEVHQGARLVASSPVTFKMILNQSMILDTVMFLLVKICLLASIR